MSDDIYREHKLAEAVPHPTSNADAPILNAMPGASDASNAEQQRQQSLAAENERAHHNQGGLRERLIEDGKANHMAGHGNGRRSDQS